jgi:uncharacterized protein (DUF1697 family)
VTTAHIALLRANLGSHHKVAMAELRACLQAPGLTGVRTLPGHLLLFGLKEAPLAGAEAALQAAISGPERVQVLGREAYLVNPEVVGRSKLAAALVERRPGTTGTGRNWNTVRKLQALAAAL